MIVDAMVIPKLFNDFLNHMSVMGKSSHTIKSYKLNLELWNTYEQFATDVTPECIGNIRHADIYKFIAQSQKRNGDNISASTAKIIMSAIKSFYTYLVDMDLIATNPMIGLKSPKAGKRLPKFLEEKDMIRLLKSVNNNNSDFPERDRAILTLFLNTAIRKNELVSINITDISSENSLIVNGKGNKEREIPLSPSCVKAIEEYKKTNDKRTSQALFINKDGERLGNSGVTHVVKKYLNIIGKGDLSTHKLRHSCLTNLVANGTDIRTVQEIAGHENIMTTSLYLHVSNKTKKKAVMNTALANI